MVFLPAEPFQFPQPDQLDRMGITCPQRDALIVAGSQHRLGAGRVQVTGEVVLRVRRHRPGTPVLRLCVRLYIHVIAYALAAPEQLLLIPRAVPAAVRRVWTSAPPAVQYEEALHEPTAFTETGM